MTSGNNIQLTGTVATQQEKDQIGQVAHAAAPGETLINDVAVSGSPTSTPPGGATSAPPSAVGEAAAAGQLPQSSNPQAGATGQQSYPPAGTQAGTAGQSSQPSQASPSGTKPSDIQSRIQAALQQEPTLASSSIMVNVTDKQVELSGTVANKSDKQTAKRIAESSAGGRKVVDHIEVSGAGNAAPAKVPPRT